MESPKGKYVIITELEVDALFTSSKGWVKTLKGNEYVYTYKTKKNPDVSVLVYSSVSPSGVSKSYGSDAIRVCAVNTVTNKGILKSKRVNRTLGWNLRVVDRVLDILADIYPKKNG